MIGNLNYLNVGCGKRYHPDWINIDILPADPGVIHCNVVKGLPFEDQTMDVVYHSHVLEHISRKDAVHFIRECHRVLKPDGVIRIAVPDLEQIVRTYLKLLDENLKERTELSQANYEWMMLELYDQTVRTRSGGDMVDYLTKAPINEKFIIDRLGEEVRPYFTGTKKGLSMKEKVKKIIKMSGSAKLFLFRSLAADFIHSFLPGRTYYKTGKFRFQGEVHQWMYDRFSLKLLLEAGGFKEAKVFTAFTSYIPEWASFNLDGRGSQIYKPDSLFMEAKK